MNDILIFYLIIAIVALTVAVLVYPTMKERFKKARK